MSDTSCTGAYVYSPVPVPALPVAGTDQLFPVHRIYCVGRNHADHAIEMGGDPAKSPFFFQKSADCVVPPGGDFPYPGETQDVHHEIELVIALGKGEVTVGVV
jgi:fumarylpyruvate hydrolase